MTEAIAFFVIVGGLFALLGMVAGMLAKIDR